MPITSSDSNGSPTDGPFRVPKRAVLCLVKFDGVRSLWIYSNGYAPLLRERIRPIQACYS